MTICLVHLLIRPLSRSIKYSLFRVTLDISVDQNYCFFNLKVLRVGFLIWLLKYSDFQLVFLASHFAVRKFQSSIKNSMLDFGGRLSTEKSIMINQNISYLTSHKSRMEMSVFKQHYTFPQWNYFDVSPRYTLFEHVRMGLTLVVQKAKMCLTTHNHELENKVISVPTA